MAAHADVFAAVADPTRRRMLNLLAERDHSVMELVDCFEVSQPAISQHLRVLREAGLVTPQKSGRQRIYRLNARPIKELADWAAYFERFWKQRLDNLDRYLARQGSNREKSS